MDERERYPRSGEFDRTVDRYRKNLSTAFEKFGIKAETIREISESGCEAALVGQNTNVDEPLKEFVEKACYLDNYRGFNRIVLTRDYITLYPTPPINWDYYVGIDLSEARYRANFVGPKVDVKYVIPGKILRSISMLPDVVASSQHAFAMSIRKENK